MGYWGAHPMEGDTPLDNISNVEEWLIESLISDIQAEESAGKNENISDDLRNFIVERDFNSETIFNDFYCDNYSFDRDRDLWNTYRHEVITQFKDEEPEFDDSTYFVIPFRFINLDIHVKSEYVKYLIEMLGDGGAEQREYPTGEGYETLDDFKNNTHHPYYYVLLVKEYATQLFDESNDELTDEFVLKHPEISKVVSKGLFESMFEKMEETGEVPFMNVQ